MYNEEPDLLNPFFRSSPEYMDELINHIFSKYSFSGDVSKWDVSNVTNMEAMF